MKTVLTLCSILFIAVVVGSRTAETPDIQADKTPEGRRTAVLVEVEAAAQILVKSVVGVVAGAAV